MTTITGTAKRERTRHGFAAITLTGGVDIWEDCPARPRGPGMLVRKHHQPPSEAFRAGQAPVGLVRPVTGAVRHPAAVRSQAQAAGRG